VTDATTHRGRAGSRARVALRFALRAALALAVVLACGWAALALAIDGAGAWLAALFLVASACLLLLRKRRAAARVAWAVMFAAILVWWFTIEPSNDRDWQEDVARVATARVDGDLISFTNVRNFAWQSDTSGVPAWEERTYDLRELVGFDVFMCDWGAKGICHTITSWEFAGGKHLAVSIETRKERSEGYSAVRGLFRQFELIYTVADESDLIGVRVQYRGERVRLYRMNVDRAHAEELLLAYAHEINRLAREPTWYNAATSNCTTSIRMNATAAGGSVPWDHRILLNGGLDEMFQERGRLSFPAGTPIDEIRRRCDVTETARVARGATDFAERIRVGLPPRHVGPPPRH
jgi:hypothetical protein